ncbi:MAG TPA: hypothetical protein ENI07_10695 [Desulfobacterales bacterium]|nr:hypothetical protein [Desulfobacterales bacterium]
MGHELGHYIYSDILEAKNKIINQYVRKRSDYRTTIDDLLKAQVERYDDISKIYRIERLVSNWIKESFCDWFGLKFIGPAYYFAFIEHFSITDPFYHPLRLNEIDSPTNVGEQSKKKEYRSFFAYPSPALRSHLLLELYNSYAFEGRELKCLGEEITKKYFKLNDQIDKNYSDDSKFEDKLQYEENIVSYKWVKEFFMSDLFKKFELILTKFDIFYKNQSDVPNLWYLFKKNITPNARLKDGFYQEPSDWRSILYASWLYKAISGILN